MRKIIFLCLLIILLSSCSGTTPEPTHEHTFAETEESTTLEEIKMDRFQPQRLQIGRMFQKCLYQIMKRMLSH